MDMPILKTTPNDLTLDELKVIVNGWIDEKLEAVYEYIYALEDQLSDENHPLTAEVTEHLRQVAQIPREKRRGIPAEQVYRELGLAE